jgi:hypothetical protein
VSGYDWSNGIYRANVLVAGPRHARARHIRARAPCGVRARRGDGIRRASERSSGLAVRHERDHGRDHGRGLNRSEVGTTFGGLRVA